MKKIAKNLILKTSSYTACTWRPFARVSTRCWPFTRNTFWPSSGSTSRTGRSLCYRSSRSLESTFKCFPHFWTWCTKLKNSRREVVRYWMPFTKSVPVETQLSKTCLPRYFSAAIRFFTISWMPGLCMGSWLISVRSFLFIRSIMDQLPRSKLMQSRHSQIKLGLILPRCLSTLCSKPMPSTW